jgi:hypothetical protein
MGWQRKLLWLTIFAVAMGYLESAVVAYLRALYYPDGFSFPLHLLSGPMAITEVFRELATLFMLAAVAALTGETPRRRLAWFLYGFAIWDIFYYVFLKLLIGWPESFLTWDILFLIPVMWTGPVIAPLVISLTMILLAMLLLFSGRRLKTSGLAWPGMTLVLTGAGVVFVSFIWDYASFMLEQYSFSAMFRSQIVQSAMPQYVPERFNWWMFLAGECMILSGCFFIYYYAWKSTGTIHENSR